MRRYLTLDLSLICHGAPISCFVPFRMERCFTGFPRPVATSSNRFPKQSHNGRWVRDATFFFTTARHSSFMCPCVSRCVLALLDYNHELTIWRASKNIVTGEWIKAS